MIYVRVSGGLGNQMFQYAFAKALKSRGANVSLHWHPHKSKSSHNGFELDCVFENDLTREIPLANHNFYNLIRSRFRRKVKIVREVNEMKFQPHFLETKSGYLDGYWQTEKYFTDIATEIRKDFLFKHISGARNQDLLAQIKNNVTCSVHIRRGDYVNHPELGGGCDQSYYRRAIDHLKSNCDDYPRFVVFSDDIPYCKESFSDLNVTYCDWNKGNDSWMDLALMRHCKHHIIANSSFSWWGAWLQKNEGITIAPKNWSQGKIHSDLVLSNWISS